MREVISVFTLDEYCLVGHTDGELLLPTLAASGERRKSLIRVFTALIRARYLPTKHGVYQSFLLNRDLPVDAPPTTYTANLSHQMNRLNTHLAPF